MRERFKFVITHNDQFTTRFSLWEYQGDDFAWQKNGYMWMSKEGFRLLWGTLDKAKVLFPNEYKLEVTDDDVPIETDAQKADDLQEECGRAAGDERELSEDSEHIGPDAGEAASLRQKESQYKSERKLKR